MISKEQFIKYLDYIKETQTKEDKINNLLDDLKIEGYCFLFSDEITHMIEMISSCMNLEYDPHDLYGNDIRYFIYELEYGKKWKPGMVTESDGTDIDMSTPEKLYNYLMREK